MRTLFIMLLCILCGVYSVEAQQVKNSNLTELATTTTKNSVEPIKTKYSWHGYQVLINPKSGACYTVRVSQKTGKEYKSYLPKEMAKKIAKEYGIEYKPKKTK